MKKVAFKIIPTLILALLLPPALSLAEQYKITTIYDGGMGLHSYVLYAFSIIEYDI